MIDVTVCFKFPNGSIAIVVIMAWPSIVYAMDIIDCTIRDGHGFLNSIVLLQFDQFVR
jgi:hypothetical protein